MDATFTRKVMIDSRFRRLGVPGSFEFELSRALTLPSKCAGFVTDIEMIHSWWTADDHNEHLYFYERYVNNGSVLTRYHRVAIKRQNRGCSGSSSGDCSIMNAAIVNGIHTVG